MAEGQGPPLKNKKDCANLIQSGLKNLVGLEEAIKVASSKFLNTAVTWSFYNAGDENARCTLCLSDFSISHGSRNDVTTHTTSKRHKKFAASASSASTRSVASYFRPEVSKNVFEAETRWAMFTAEHNLTFLSSDHTNKLFAKMFPDTEIAKCTAIVK